MASDNTEVRKTDRSEKDGSTPGPSDAKNMEAPKQAAPATTANAVATDETAATAGEPAKAAPARRSKGGRTVSSGVAHVNATFNNTQVSITDQKGAVLAWSSSGRMGFKGTRKSTAYAATVVAQDAARQVAPYRMNEIEVRVQGPGAGRESAIRAFQASGFNVTVIKDVTPIPHNGCRPRKRRRV